MIQGCGKFKTSFYNTKFCEYHIEMENFDSLISTAKQQGFEIVKESDIKIVLKKKDEMVLNIFLRKNIVKVTSKNDSFAQNWKMLTIT
jgi:hypothetical protein